MIKPNHIFVVDTKKKPLMPCTPCIASKLLDAGKAAIFRRFPFTIILKKQCQPSRTKLQLKIDPGSSATGLALLDGSKVIWVAELNHRGSLIKKN